MANSCHIIGTDVIVSGVFKDGAGTLTTPTVYTLDHVDPSGNTTNIPQGSITVVSPGVLEATVPADEVGVWRVRWTVTVDGNQLVEAGVFCVKDDGV